MPVPRLLAAVLPLVLFASIPVAAADAKPAKLKISVSGLPRGAKAKVTVRGPHLKQVVRRSKTLSGVRPGRYTLTLKPTKVTRARDGIKRGSRVLPATKKLRVRVKKGKRATAKLRYGTIILPGVRRLDGAPLACAATRRTRPPSSCARRRASAAASC